MKSGGNNMSRLNGRMFTLGRPKTKEEARYQMSFDRPSFIEVIS